MPVTQILHVGRLLIVTAAAALFLSACASKPKIFVNENPGVDFSSYKTYNYEEVMATDERKGYRSILSNYFIEAMDREMAARGYQKADNPDLIINFYVATEEKIRTTQSPTMGGGYYGYRGYGGYGAYGGYETRVTQYTEGTVNIDIVDNKRDELAWEGVTVGKITDEVRENLKAAASAVVNEIMARYPYNAAGFVPPVTADGEING